MKGTPPKAYTPPKGLPSRAALQTDYEVYPGQPLVCATAIVTAYPSPEAAAVRCTSRDGTPHNFCMAEGSSEVPGAGGQASKAAFALLRFRQHGSIDKVIADLHQGWRNTVGGGNYDEAVRARPEEGRGPRTDAPQRPRGMALIMFGKFTFKQNKVAGGHDIYYQGPLATSPLLLCGVVKRADGKWEVPLPSGTSGPFKDRWPGKSEVTLHGPLGPFKDRWHAGYAYLVHLLEEPTKTLDMKVRCQWADLDLRRRDPRVIDAELAGKIYDVLVEKCRASADEKSSFVHGHTERPHTCTEWRFCGMLGFGGKFRNHYDRLYVDCYREDEDPETLTIMAETNEAIFNLWQQQQF